MCKKVKIGKAAVVATAKPLGLLLCSSTPSFSTPYFFEWSRNGWDKEASSEKNTKIFLNLFRLSKIFLKLLNCYHIVNCLIKHNSWQRFEKIFKKQKRFYKPYFFFPKKIVSLEFPKCFRRYITLDSYLVHFFAPRRRRANGLLQRIFALPWTPLRKKNSLRHTANDHFLFISFST